MPIVNDAVFISFHINDSDTRPLHRLQQAYNVNGYRIYGRFEAFDK